MYVGWFSLYIGLLLKTKDPIRVWLLDIFCSVFSCMYCWVLVFVLSHFYVLIYMYWEMIRGWLGVFRDRPNIYVPWSVLKFVLDSFKDFFNIICSWTVLTFVFLLFQRLFVNKMCSWTVLTFVLDYFRDISLTLCVLELFLNLFLIISKTYIEHHMYNLIYGT